MRTMLGVALVLVGCVGAPLAAAPTCDTNADCLPGRCVYQSPAIRGGRCVELVNGKALCGGSLDACCDDGSCIAGHRCADGICEAVR